MTPKTPYYVVATDDDVPQTFIHKVWARSEQHAADIVERARPYSTVHGEVINAEDFEAWVRSLAEVDKAESDAEMIDFIVTEKERARA